MIPAPSPAFKIASKGLIALAMAGVIVQLPGCGGGGTTSGAPLNPAPGPAAPAPLAVNPPAIEVYANQPSTLFVTGGIPPYRAFSSSPSVLPVTLNVIGSIIPLTPNNVSDALPIQITITDAANNTTAASVQVRSATISSQLLVTANNATPGAGCGDAVCSGQFATAEVTLRAAGGAPIAGRQVRFEAVQGQFNFTNDDAGNLLSKTFIATTDAFGRAVVRLRADVTAATASAIIRATDLTSGNRVDQRFSIAQFTSGEGTLSAIPGEGYTSKGFYKGECGGSSGDFLIFGGTAPYTIRTALPNAFTLSTPAGQTGSQVTVPTQGGRFTARAAYFGAGCSGFKDNIAITDSTGRTVSVTYEVSEGSEPLPTAPPPASLAITPPARTASLNGTTCNSQSFDFFVQGGVFPYTIATSSNNAPVSQAGSTLTVSLNAGGVPAGQNVTLSVRDSASTLTSAQVICPPLPTAAPPAIPTAPSGK